MGKYEHKVTIQRSIHTVFSYVADWNNAPSWQEGTGQVTVVPDKPLRVGSMVTQERREAGADLLLNADVVDYKPNKSLELRGVIGRLQFRDTYSFSPMGGATAVTLERVTSGGIIARIIAPLMPFRMRRQVEADLENLKQVLEEEQS